MGAWVVNVRKKSGPLTHHQVRDLVDADHLASSIGKPLNTFITLHPGHLLVEPPHVGKWLQAELNALRIWCCRMGFGYYAIWVRENYMRPRSEHVHILLHVPLTDFDRFAERLSGRFDYSGVVEVQKVTSPLIWYLLKQMTPQAWFALGRQIRRQAASDRTGARVAAVIGKRCGMSRSLTL